jgi:hypothetical protein
MDERPPRFQRAFVAMSYLLGARRDALGTSDLGPEASALLRALSSSDKETRARALAREITPIAMALEEGGLR